MKFIDGKIEKYKKYAPLIIRIGISLVFLWFGLNQIFNSNYFLGYLPDFAFELPIKPTMLVLMNGVFETIFAILLLLGFYTRITALLLAIHLAGITINLGFNEIGVRDFGLTLATFAVFLNGPDQCSIDLRKKRKNKEVEN